MQYRRRGALGGFGRRCVFGTRLSCLALMGPESITGYGRKTISCGEYLLALGIRPLGLEFCSSFRRKPESIFAFAFSLPRLAVFTPKRGGSESNTKTKGESSEFRIGTPRDNKAVAAPLDKKSKWIPAFAGMTAVDNSDQGWLFQQPPQGRSERDPGSFAKPPFGVEWIVRDK